VVQPVFTFLVAALSAVLYHYSAHRRIVGCWPASAMIVMQAAFSCIPFMNAAFHFPQFDAAAWLRVIGVALAASVIGNSRSLWHFRCRHPHRI